MYLVYVDENMDGIVFLINLVLYTCLTGYLYLIIYQWILMHYHLKAIKSISNSNNSDQVTKKMKKGEIISISILTLFFIVVLVYNLFFFVLIIDFIFSAMFIIVFSVTFIVLKNNLKKNLSLYYKQHQVKLKLVFSAIIAYMVLMLAIDILIFYYGEYYYDYGPRGITLLFMQIRDIVQLVI